MFCSYNRVSILGVCSLCDYTWLFYLIFKKLKSLTCDWTGSNNCFTCNSLNHRELSDDKCKCMIGYYDDGNNH